MSAVVSPRSSSRRALVLEARARTMRHQPTASEAALWQALRRGEAGVAFRRQVVVGGRYIADLLAPSIKLVVEVDGACHADQRVSDTRRDRVLSRLGYRVLHLDAGLVLRSLPLALQHVKREVEALAP